MAKIMVIDDDIAFAEDVAHVLRDSGHTVHMLDRADEAVAHLSDLNPDLLVLDVMFPENPAGGFDLARQIRRSPGLGDLPIILLTAVNEEFPMDFSTEDIDPAWMPVQVFLEKPLNPAILIESVRTVLENSERNQ